MGIKAGNLPISTIDNTDYLIITEGEAPKRVLYPDVKNNIIGTETLTTSSQTVKGAINENKANIDLKANDTDNSRTTTNKTVTGAINEVNASVLEKADQNEIINGNIDFWQRGTTATNPTNIFVADRFLVYNGISGASPANIIHSKLSLANGELPKSKNAYRITVDGAGSVNAIDSYMVQQAIERGTRNLCGANKKVTVSFWARSNIANKKIGVYLLQKYGSGGSPSTSETIPGNNFTLTNAWQKFSLTLNVNTLDGKTFGTNDDDHLKLIFLYAYGTTSAATVSDTVAETFRGSGYIDITQIKLESGDKATPFVPRFYGEELALCQRYYKRLTPTNGQTANTTLIQCVIQYGEMRAQPTVQWDGGTLRVSDDSTYDKIATPTLGSSDFAQTCVRVGLNGFSGLIANRFHSISGGVGRILLDSEMY